MVRFTPTPSRRQKAIRKLNNIIIARLTTNNRPNILSDTWRFDTTADWKMLGEEFETWPADPIPDATLLALGMHVTNLGYLEDGAPRVTELPDGGTEELDFGLDHAAAIPDNDDQPPPDLSDSEAERAKKKEEKARRRQQRKITLAQATSSVGVGAPSAAVAGGPSSAVSGGGLSSAVSGGGGPSSAVSGGGLSSAVSGGGPSSAVSGGGLSSAVSGGGPSSAGVGGGPSSAVGGGSASAVSGGGPLSPAAGGGSLSPAAGGGSLTPVAGGGPSSPAAAGGPSSPVAGGGPSSPAAAGASPSAGPPAFSLSGTPSRAPHSSLSSSAAPLAGSATPITGKRSFDEAFIKQRPLALTRLQEDVDLSFAQCTCSESVKMNRSWQSELYDPKPVCLLEAIPLLSLLFWDDSFIPCSKHTSLLAKKLGLTTGRQVNNVVTKERMEAVWHNKTIDGLDTLFECHPEW